MEVIAVVLVLVLCVSGYSACSVLHTKYKTRNPSLNTVNNITIVNDVVVGEATYFYNTVPEAFATVTKVQNGLVYFNYGIGKIYTLPISEFLVQFTRRQQTRIANK
jgi:hypothetical protein